MKNWYKEPLLHFLLLGALIFVLFAVVDKNEGLVAGNKISVTATDIERLQDNWSRKWNRPPTHDELKGLIEAHVREEVYYREALGLGLDRNDTIIRRRMMQKMEFLTNDIAELKTPDETALNKFLAENPDRYQIPARISFTHIYFSTDKRGEKARPDVVGILDELRAATTPTPQNLKYGDGFMMGYDFSRQTPEEVARLFGKGFAEQLFQLKTDLWQGPIESGYGLHLVRVSEFIDSRTPELSEVIDEVRRDRAFEQRKKTNEAIYKRLKDRYEIVIANIPTQPRMGTMKVSYRETP